MRNIVKLNQKCMNLVHNIVEECYMQQIYSCSQDIKQLSKYLSEIIEGLTANDLFANEMEELLQVLQAVTAAQQNKDYILIADILEGDLHPLLLSIQNEILHTYNIACEKYFEKNMNCLKECADELYNILKTDQETDDDSFTVVSAITGQLTLKYCFDNTEIMMHSLLSPEREAQTFIKEYVKLDVQDCYVWGMGLGYHVRELLHRMPSANVTVLESHLSEIRLAMDCFDWTEWIRKGRLKILYNAEPLRLLRAIQKDGYLIVHGPSLRVTKQGKAKEALEDYLISINSIREQEKDLEINFYALQRAQLPEGSKIFRDFVENRKVVIAAGGPSLQDEIDNLIKYRNQIVILSVGTVAKKLIQCGIKPDFIIITDAWENMYYQVENITENIPLLLLSTASAKILDYYKGPVYLLYQQGYELAEKIAEKNNYPQYHTGGSVTTLALDMVLCSKAECVVFVGVDMAYTYQKTHAFDLGGDIDSEEEIRHIPCVDGGTVLTGRNLDIYRKWIERRLQESKATKVYNVSHGARIQGTCEVSFAAAMMN